MSLEPWTTFAILCKLESAEGQTEAAADARRQAIAAYLAYRRDGGESTSPAGELCAAVAQAIASGQTRSLAAELAERQQSPDLPAYVRSFFAALTAILAGARDPAIADDPDLDYDDAVELLLLLEHLDSAR